MEPGRTLRLGTRSRRTSATASRPASASLTQNKTVVSPKVPVVTDGHYLRRQGAQSWVSTFQELWPSRRVRSSRRRQARLSPELPLMDGSVQWSNATKHGEVGYGKHTKCLPDKSWIRAEPEAWKPVTLAPCPNRWKSKYDQTTYHRPLFVVALSPFQHEGCTSQLHPDFHVGRVHISYRIGDKFMLNLYGINIPLGPTLPRKFMPNWTGPFAVLSGGPAQDTYKLDLASSNIPDVLP
ncbi:hypothetical protein BDK51DRAFT_44683 [Blyttiomyces helicus]|uniref:Uncharacterized protein n=1 Tax=Blyttiomyces helicus TaxID=388810 RepID=A0A4P9WNB2_9FUNG|nr:hypothetical protein BDK51DRAFT_44683 [Blyttiomyces helicus]|eukprot:RKO93755.1 hypothetical protein BDK51DRAFT_44683 [Blyttiomyces helicus]